MSWVTSVTGSPTGSGGAPAEPAGTLATCAMIADRVRPRSSLSSALISIIARGERASSRRGSTICTLGRRSSSTSTDAVIGVRTGMPARSRIAGSISSESRAISSMRMLDSSGWSKAISSPSSPTCSTHSGVCSSLAMGLLNCQLSVMREPRSTGAMSVSLALDSIVPEATIPRSAMGRAYAGSSSSTLVERSTGGRTIVTLRVRLWSSRVEMRYSRVNRCCSGNRAARSRASMSCS